MKTQNGLSLAEVLVALGLFAVMLGLPMLSTSSRSQGDSRAAAGIVASELKEARERARSSNEPVALGIPSENGTVAHSQSFYHLAGWKNPRIVRGFSMESEVPETYCFAGVWDGPAFQANLERADLDSVAFDLAEWGAPSALNVIVFLPSGAVVTDLPVTPHGCHLVVTNGLDYQATSVDGKSTFRLTEASKPYTVTVSTTGGVEVHQGVYEGTLTSALAGETPSPSAVYEPPGTAGNSDPIVVGELFPLPHPVHRPAGAAATVKLDGFATLRLEAEDPDGDRLYAEWIAEDGTFSSDGPIEMEWDPELKKWVAWHEWTPPPGAVAGDQFELSYRVTDDRGGEALGTFGLTGVVEVLPEGRILFTMRPDPSLPNNVDIYSVNSDGTDVVQLTDHPDKDEDPEFSPDGSKIVFASRRDNDQAIFIMNSDGTDIQRLIGTTETKINWIYDPTFDPTGTMIAFCGQEDRKNIYLINVDGSLPSIGVAPTDEPSAVGLVTQLGDSAFEENTHQLDINFWHPAGEYIIVQGGLNQTRPDSKGGTYNTAEDIYMLEVATGDFFQMTNRPATVTVRARLQPIPGPGGVERVLFQSEDTTMGPEHIYQTDLDLSTRSFGPLTRVPLDSTSSSPDGQFVYEESGGEVAIQPISGGAKIKITDTDKKVAGTHGWAMIR